MTREQPTSFSVWLDLNLLSKSGAPKPAMPIWMESFQDESVAAKNGEPPITVYRIRLRRMPSLHRELLVRVFFDDIAGLQPLVSAWSETGRAIFERPPLGTQAGLPASEQVIVPIEGADYVDIAVPGNGSNVRGIFASSLRDASVKEPIDFHELTPLRDPFGNHPVGVASEEDTRVFGRLKATLDREIVKLFRNGEPSARWEFELASRPLAAVVTFEILNADLTAPPVVSVNGAHSGFANVQWPDLADPGFRGESRGAEASMRFQYTGWIRAQFVIPGDQLQSGPNGVLISTGEGGNSIAVRNVELQLKHKWKHFDSIITPASQ